MSEPDTRTLTEVAVGIVFDGDANVLLAQRPPGKPYAGWWEFPGGKLEPGESVHQALARELAEELGLQIGESLPWLVREHSYEHARVRLHFRRVHTFDGLPQSREGQRFAWCDARDPGVEPLLPASVPLMRLLGLPSVYGISCAAVVGVEEFLTRLRNAVRNGLMMVQLREPMLDERQFNTLFSRSLALCREYGASLLVNSQHPRRYWDAADGVHCRSRDIATVAGNRPPGWIAASCHDAHQLAQAARLNADFAVLGPVRTTSTHPDIRPMGWHVFSDLVAQAQLPVYALGGIRPGQVQRAQQAGAHGIAMISGVFGSQ